MSSKKLQSLLQEITKKKSLVYKTYRKKSTTQHWTQKIIADMKTRLPEDQYLIWLKKFNEQIGKGRS